MADVIDATETKITRKVEGAEHDFAFLNAYDRAELMRADLAQRVGEWEDRRKRLLNNLEQSGVIEPGQKLSELETFEERWPRPNATTEFDWINFVNDIRNEPLIFARSLAKFCSGDAEAMAKLVRLPLADKAKICGLTIVDKPAGQEHPNPEAPANLTYTIPEANSTGAGLKPESNITAA